MLHHCAPCLSEPPQIPSLCVSATTGSITCFPRMLHLHGWLVFEMQPWANPLTVQAWFLLKLGSNFGYATGRNCPLSILFMIGRISSCGYSFVHIEHDIQLMNNHTSGQAVIPGSLLPPPQNNMVSLWGCNRRMHCLWLWMLQYIS